MRDVWPLYKTKIIRTFIYNALSSGEKLLKGYKRPKWNIGEEGRRKDCSRRSSKRTFFRKEVFAGIRVIKKKLSWKDLAKLDLLLLLLALSLAWPQTGGPSFSLAV